MIMIPSNSKPGIYILGLLTETVSTFFNQKQVKEMFCYEFIKEVYTVHCTLHTVHCTLYTLHFFATKGTKHLPQTLIC